MLLLSARMRGDNIPHSVYLDRLAIENDAIPVRHEGVLVRPGGKTENPERY